MRSVSPVIKIVGIKPVSLRHFTLILLGPQVKFDRVKARYDQAGSTFFTGNVVSLLRFRIDIDLFSALRTNGRWHTNLRNDLVINLPSFGMIWQDLNRA